MELKNLSKFLPLSLVVVATLVALSCGAPEDSEDEAASTSGEKSGKPGETTKSGTSSTSGTSGSSGSTGSTCSATSNTTATTTLNSYGCALLTRDTSSCKADREAQGLSDSGSSFPAA